MLSVVDDDGDCTSSNCSNINNTNHGCKSRGTIPLEFGVRGR